MAIAPKQGYIVLQPTHQQLFAGINTVRGVAFARAATFGVHMWIYQLVGYCLYMNSASDPETRTFRRLPNANKIRLSRNEKIVSYLIRCLIAVGYTWGQPETTISLIISIMPLDAWYPWHRNLDRLGQASGPAGKHCSGILAVMQNDDGDGIPSMLLRGENHL